MTINIDHDGILDRKRLRRNVVFALTIIIVCTLPVIFGIAVGNVYSFKWSTVLFGGLGFNTGVYIMMKLFPRFWIVVPQTTAFVTTDQFAPATCDPNIPYGPGGHVSFPWELRQQSGNITLDVMTIRFSEIVPTKTSAMIVDGTVQFKFDLSHVTTVVRIGPENVERGFIAELQQWFSINLAKKTGEEVKNEIKTFQKNIEKEFLSNRNTSKELLRKYGLIVVGIQISGIDFTKKVQEARDSTQEIEAIVKSAGIILGKTPGELKEALDKGDIDQGTLSKAIERALVASGNATLDIKRYDITGIDPKLLGAVAAVAGKVTAKSKGDAK